MQVDFYQLSHDPVERVLPAIARKLLDQGDRLMVIDGREGYLERLSHGLWDWKPESFLAHGFAGEGAGEGDEAMQPVLLSPKGGAPANGARHIALTDGLWRDEALNYDRAFFFFDEQTLEAARACWRMVKGRDGVEPRFWRQEGRRWVQVA